MAKYFELGILKSPFVDDEDIQLNIANHLYFVLLILQLTDPKSSFVAIPIPQMLTRGPRIERCGVPFGGGETISDESIMYFTIFIC